MIMGYFLIKKAQLRQLITKYVQQDTVKRNRHQKQVCPSKHQMHKRR
jgi:hypothetical protein